MLAKDMNHGYTSPRWFDRDLNRKLSTKIKNLVKLKFKTTIKQNAPLAQLG